MSVTINNIEFKNISGLDKTSSKFAFVNKTGVSSTVFTNMAPSSTAEQYISRYALINGLQIDWNGMVLGDKTINTTGELLSN